MFDPDSLGSSYAREVVERVRRSRAAQGLPLGISDPAALVTVRQSLQPVVVRRLKPAKPAKGAA